MERPLDAEVFICGCEHSGTSLVATMFAAHPDVHVPLVETNIFKEGRDPQDGLSMLRADTRAGSRRYLVEKTPPHISRLETLRDAAPDARVVIPVRDGRSVVASLIRKKGARKSASSARRWIRANSIAAAERSAPDVLVYRHEDLVRNPRGTLASICSFAGIPFDDAMLEYHKQERLWFQQSDLREGSGVGRDEHRALRNWQVNQPIFDSGDRWRTELSAADLDLLVTGHGRKLMETFGYLPESRSRLAEAYRRAKLRRASPGSG